MNDAAYEQGAALIAKSVPVIVVWGVMEDGSCACPRGAECTAAGKHPVGSGWQNQAITDESDLYDAIGDVDTPFNIGIPFGPRSGVIDIEYDDERGEKTANDLGLPQLGTASFRSSRSRHFLFRYDSRLPQKAVIPDVNGLEIRIGAGDRGAHSVAPGSRHKTGASYEWVPGASISEADILPLPESILRLLEGAESSGSSDAANLMRTTSIVSAGGRHDAVRKTAFCLAASMGGRETPANINTAYTCISALNELKCDPPLDDSEVRVLVASAFQAYARWSKDDPKIDSDDAAEKFNDRVAAVQQGCAERASIARTDLQNTVASSGIVPADDGGWEPGTWRLEIEDSSDRQYTIVLEYTHVDHRGNRSRRNARVTLTPTEFQRADIVATRILNATGTLEMNPIPGFFSTVWNGRAATRRTEAIMGLRARMLAEAVLVEPEAGTTPWIMYGRTFLACLTSPDRESMECDRPDDDGNPTWVEGHGMTFLWSQVLTQAQDSCRTANEDSSKRFRASVAAHFNGEEIFKTMRFRDSRGKQRRFQVITEEDLERLSDYVDSLS